MESSFTEFTHKNVNSAYASIPNHVRDKSYQQENIINT